MMILSTLANKALGKKVKKLEQKHVVTFFILKDLLKFLKNKVR